MFTLTGVRTVIESPFPAVIAHLWVFLHMTGHRGAANCQIKIERAATSELVLESDVQVISFIDPTVSVCVIFDLQDCVLPEAGLYYVQIFTEAKQIGERLLRLHNEE